MAIETTDQTSDTTRGALAWWGRAGEFFTEVRNEMKRVTWPSQREVYATTIVVILTSVVFGVYLWSIDMLLDRGVLWVFTKFGSQR